MTYDALLKNIMKEHPGADISCNIGEGLSIGEPIIQYEETDWELINRLASHFQQFVTSDLQYATPKLYFGTPPGRQLQISEDISYTAGKDLVAYHQAGGGESGLHNTDFFYYDMTSDQHYQIGDIVEFRDKELVVSQKTIRLEEIQLAYSYRLSRKKGIQRRLIHNDRLSGVSLEGEVLDVKGEQVKLHLTIDKEQPKEKAHWFTFAPPTGNAMYCMPQIGTSATLYLPDADGKGAIITGCIRKNGGECEKSGDPNIRYFGTEHGSEAKLSPTGIDIVSGSKEPLKLTLEDDNGITLTSHKKLLLQADSEIIIQSEKRVVIQAESQIMIVKTGQTSGIAIENEYHILGNQVIADGSDRTSYPVYDDAPQIGTPPPPEPKPPFSWGKLVGNVLGALAVVAAVVVVAVVVVATLGAGAVVIGAVAAGAAIAGTAAVVSQAASDIARGEVSDFGAYGWAALRESTIGAISGAIFGPFGAGAVIGGKMTFGAVVNGFESVIRQTMMGEGFSLETLMNDVAIGALTAGILDSRIVKGIGGAVVKKISSVAPWIQKGIGAVGQQFSKKVDDLSKLGNKMGQKYMKEARELLDDVAASIKQAGNKLAGPMPVHLGPNVDLPNSNVWKSSDPRQQQKFWDEMEQGKKELAERMSKNADGKGKPKTDYDKLKDRLNERYKEFVNKKRQNVPQTSDELLPNELNHGKFGELPEVKGDNITGHHMPSNKYMKENYDIDMDESYAINLEHPFPGVGGRHRRTFTNGMGSKNRPEDYNLYMSLNSRDALAFDMNDLRRILKEDGLYNKETKEKLKEYIKYYENYQKNNVNIFKKP
ncbi:hypothetical protein PGLA_04485 [Paenibacillus glacialis]|uniref:Uncharacterized protein n=2 Tax=Paenibacillus glacialis TaxID=494026 RepID=A0A168N8B8_9BACL|nr:hypothetical protein PGLA_04485 [Paenibacillus glacialis]